MSAYPSAQQPPILTVTELTGLIKTQLEGEYPYICIRGEISNLKAQSSGHLYFSLKDENAQIACVLFAASASRLPMQPKNGDEVLVKGQLTVYEARGNYQILVKELEAVGLGKLLLRLEELKRTIKKRGWFEKEYKKPLPKQPSTIGVVTSPTGAVIQDILSVLARRHAGFTLLLNPVKVQGEGAAAEIAQAIDEMNRYKLCDVLIVGRGGGSLEDLFAFNEEVVAEAIFKSQIPVISAVGHETDHCIADYVADVRAPTPSAAAELVLSEKAAQQDFLATAQKRLDSVLLAILKKDRERVQAAKRHPYLATDALLARPRQRLDDAEETLEATFSRAIRERRLKLQGLQKVLEKASPLSQLTAKREQLKAKSHQLDMAFAKLISTKSLRLDATRKTLAALDPREVLKKGYSIVQDGETQQLLTSTEALCAAKSLQITIADGKVLVEARSSRIK